MLFYIKNFTFVCFRVDSITKIQQKLDYLRGLLEDAVQFKSIYRYAFDFARVRCCMLCNMGGEGAKILDCLIDLVR